MVQYSQLNHLPSSQALPVAAHMIWTSPQHK